MTDAAVRAIRRMLVTAALVLAAAGTGGAQPAPPPPPPPPPPPVIPDLRGTWTGEWAGRPFTLVLTEQTPDMPEAGLYVGPWQIVGTRSPGVRGFITYAAGADRISTDVRGGIGLAGPAVVLVLRANPPSGYQSLWLRLAPDGRLVGEGRSDFAWGPTGPATLARTAGPRSRAMNGMLMARAAVPAPRLWVPESSPGNGLERLKPARPARGHGASVDDQARPGRFTSIVRGAFGPTPIATEAPCGTPDASRTWSAHGGVQ